LVKEVLTDSMIAAGEAFTNALERKNWSFVAAFWLYDWENNRWKLLIASPVVDQKGPLEAYREVLPETNATTPPLEWMAVQVVSPKDRYVRELLELVERGLQLDGRRHRGRVVEDSYVYRVRPTATAA
jgi:hypothetical protein